MQSEVLNALEQGATVVTGSHHLARALRREYNAIRKDRGDTGWRTPTVLPWHGWMSALWEDCQLTVGEPRILLDPWQERTLWQNVISESEHSSDLLQAGATAASVQEAWALATAWRLDMALAGAAGSEECRVFAAWARRFQACCDHDSLLDGAHLADFLRIRIAHLRLPTAVLLTGFDEFTPQQNEFLEACRSAGCRVAIAGREASRQAEVAIRVGFPDADRELDAAARWASKLLVRDCDARIGVVIPDLSARRRQVARLFRNVLEPTAQLPGRSDLSRLFHISAGEPLSAHPLVTSAVSILSLSPQRNEWSMASGLILNPYIAGAAAERERRGLLDLRMRETGEMQVSMASLRRLCREERTACPVLDRTIGSWMRVRDQVPATATADVWSQTFSSLLAAMEWPGERQLTSVEYQVAEAWNRALSQFAAIGAFAGDLSIGDAVSLLSRIAAETIFQPESEDTPVQVLGTLEASGLHFDHLWIAGLHDEAWPSPPKPNPFLPIRMQREAGLPRCSAERELEFAALVTRRLLASAPNVVVSYQALVDDHEVSPSPLILPVRKTDRAELGLDDSPAYVETIQASREMDQLVDEQAPPIESWERGGTTVFQFQAACPFHAFAELRLGAETLEIPVPGLDARRRGTLVHTALEEFWKEVRTHDALCSRGDIGEVIRTSVRTAIERLQRASGGELPRRFSELESRRLERLLGDWLEIEKQRSAFEVIQPEGERYADLGAIHVRIRPDRVDRLPDGSDLIIDYKTRQTSVNEWTSERPDEPQLPLYSATHNRPLTGVVFGQLKAGDLRFRGWTSASGIVPGAESADLASMVGEWRTVLERLAGEFRAGHAEAGPKDRSKSCRYCSLAGLCRVAECYSLGDEEEAVR